MHIVQGTARKEMLDLEDDICRSHNLSFHLVPSYKATLLSYFFTREVKVILLKISHTYIMVCDINNYTTYIHTFITAVR